MFKILDGRNHLYQWDLDRKLIVEDNTINKVYFCNKLGNCSVVRNVYEVNGMRLVDVPNIILQKSFNMFVYGYDSNYTKYETLIEIKARTKPEDYIYTDEELKVWDELEQRIIALEEAEIDIDLSNYYTKEETNAAIEQSGKASILYTEQTLTEEQKAQARANIGIEEELKEITYTLDNNNGTTGAVFYVNGSMGTSGRHTDYIALEGYTRLVANCRMLSKYCLIAFYDAGKAYIPDVSVPGTTTLPAGNNNIAMDIPAGAAYCVLQTYPGSDNIAASITLYPADTEIKPLEGKKIAVIGDSISSTDYTTPNYWQLIQEKYGGEFLNYAISATRIAYNENDTRKENCFVNRYAAMSDEADAVIVMGGTNDAWDTPIGTPGDTGKTTMWGAVKTLLFGLVKKYPGKPIIVCLPIKRKYDGATAMESIETVKALDANTYANLQYSCALIQHVCKMYALPCINLYEESGISANESGDWGAEYFIEDDNLHPSALGEKRIAAMVGRVLLEQMNYQ